MCYTMLLFGLSKKIKNKIYLVIFQIERYYLHIIKNKNKISYILLKFSP